MTEVVPAIIPKSFEDLTEQMALVRKFVSRVQVDVMDGKFAPQTTWPYGDSEHFREVVVGEEEVPFRKSIGFEVDMMVNEPEEHMNDWVAAGASALVVHIDSTDVFTQISNFLRERDTKVGMALKPSIDNERIYEHIDEIDFVQFMGNNKIGYHGVKLDEKVYEKVRDLREKRPDITIAVDIGVNEKTAPKLIEAGVNKLVSGSAIFASADLEKTIKSFQNLS